MAHPKDVTVVSVPSDVGSIIKGKSLAPGAFEAVGFSQLLQRAGYNVRGHNALPDGPKTWSLASTGPNGARREDENVEVCRLVRTALESTLASDGLPPFQIIIGGECCMTPAIMSAFSHRFSPGRVGLLYVDADADLAIPNEAGSVGSVASMTLTHLTMKQGALESMKQFSKPDGSPVIDASNIVLFGLNMDLPSNRRDQLGYLFDEGFRVVTSSAVAANAGQRAKQALEWMQERVDHIIVHLDVDAIDGRGFPLANVPNFTGADLDAITTAIKVFLASPSVCALSIAEANPDHDPGLVMTKSLVGHLVDAFETRSRHL